MDRARHLEDLSNAFQRRFGGPPEAVVHAPGRVNLIGEHTDYNEGLALPLAINREVVVAARRRDDHSVIAYAANLERSCQFELPVEERPAAHVVEWCDYLKAVAWAYRMSGQDLPGLDLLVAGDVPIGAGLSSSAALEVALAVAFQTLGGFRLTAPDTALLCRKAENEYVGVQCGIMDQFTAANGRAGHAILLDCRDLSFRYVPLPPDTAVLVIDSMIRRELGNTAYNERRAECAEAVRLLRQKMLDVRSLRDVSPEALPGLEAMLPERIKRRCRHVVSENQRVQEAAAALEAGDVPRVGKLMVEAHESLREDYEVSLPELDRLVQMALRAGAWGARLTGAGFGGCVVSLVPAGTVERFCAEVGEIYERESGRRPPIYVCEATEGAGALIHDV